MRVDGHGVESICEALREQGLTVAPRSYRAWKTLPICDRAWADAELCDKLRQVRTGGPDGRPLPEILYGRRKMTAWLARNGFPEVSKHTVGPADARRGHERPRPGPGHPHHDPRQDRRQSGRRPAQPVLQLPAAQPRLGHRLYFVASWSGFVYVAFAIDLYSPWAGPPRPART